MSDPIQQDPQYQQMAELLNFDQGSGTADADGTEDELTLFHHPEDEPTQRRFSQKGTTKLAFVTGGVLLAAILIGSIANSLFRPQQIAQTDSPEEVYEEQDSLTLEWDEASDEEDGELGELRTEVALQNQAMEMAQMEARMAELGMEEAVEEPIEPEPEPTATTPSPAPAPAPQPAVIPQPAPSPQFVQPQVATPMFSPRPEEEKQDPWEKWQAFSRSGTAGQVQTVAYRAPGQSSAPMTNRTPVTRASQGTVIGPARTVPPGSTSPGRPVTRISQGQSTSPTVQTPTASTVAQTPSTGSGLGTYLNGYEPVPGMLHPTNQTVPIGTTATATVLTPILWPGDGSSAPSSRDPATPKYIVTLDEPLNSPDGQMVFPRGAQMVVTVAPIDVATGIATLDVLAVIRDDQAYSIPPGQLQIRGADGMPLVAQRFNDPGGAIFGMDAGLFVISGLANLGSILNRPRSSTVINSDFQGAIATEYNDPNFLGAVLEGGAGELADRLSERNARSIEALSQQPTTWYLPQGTRVQLFVNQQLRI